MKTIVWDVDDVLNDLMRTWFQRAWLPAHPRCPIQYEQISANPPHELLATSKAEYLASLDEFRLSQLYAEMPPVTEVLEWLHRHGGRTRHIALTAAPMRAASASAAWVMRHFGRWIRTFHLIPSPRDAELTPVYDRTKGEALRWWPRVNVFIDDDPANVASAQATGIPTLLIPRPWNDSPATLAETLENLTRLIDN